MSMRNFLDIRYTFPGYTFIIFFIGISYNHLQYFLPKIEGTTISLLIGLSAIIIGAPIGFYVSQVWYFFNTMNYFGLGVYGSQIKKRKYIELLHEKGIDESRHITINVLDYLFHQGIKNQNTLREYVRKRWNMYNIMGSSIAAIISGIFFGVLFRNHISSYCDEWFYIHEITVFIIGVILIGLFSSGMYIFRIEHENMVYTIVRNQMINNEWKSKIPKEFFKPTNKETINDEI